ncbi:MAG: zinc-dependent metalloprotease [Prevotella sp.]|jgi:hypothetical protein
MKRKEIITALFVAFALGAQAQSIEMPLPCRVGQKEDGQNWKVGKVSWADMQQMTTRSSERPEKYVIPVVFHVFGTDFNGHTVTADLIRSALKKTNEDFNCLTTAYPPSGDDDPEFDKLNTPLPIEFRLAEIGPTGAATTGIVFHRLERGFGNYNGGNMVEYAWDNKRYMNVYIMNDLYGDGVTNNSGVSWYPDWYMTEHKLARVVYNGAYLDTNTDENFRRVLTHEFGHFLGLAHTFDYDPDHFDDGCSTGFNGEENPGDYVDDTPSADRAQMGPNDLNCHGQKTNWTNYMNYSYVRTSMFTKGQVERMIYFLDDSSRKCLWEQSNLDKVFYKSDEARIVLDSRDDVMEDCDAEGVFSKEFRFKVMYGQAASGPFVLGKDYWMKNIPVGLSPELVNEDGALILRMKGKASDFTQDKKIQIKFAASVVEEFNTATKFQPLRLLNYDGTENNTATNISSVLSNVDNNATQAVIYNLKGQRMWYGSSDEAQSQLNSFASGVYIVVYKNDDIIVSKQKILKKESDEYQFVNGQ